MGNSPVNVAYQGTVWSDGSYSFVFMGQFKNLNFYTSVSSSWQKTVVLMKSLEKLQLCPGFSL